MRVLKPRITPVLSIFLGICLHTGKLQAQGITPFNPAQLRQTMMGHFREQMAVTEDREWKPIEAAIINVMNAKTKVVMNPMNTTLGSRRPGTGANGQPPQSGVASSSALQEMQDAIAAKAPDEEIKAKLAKLRDANAANEAKLEAARAELKKLLNARQEAIAVMSGLLK